MTLQTLDVSEPWPFEAGRFDAVVATLVLEHVEDLVPVFRKVRRVLRDGGRFYLAELHPYRQSGGTQTHFEDEATGERVVIDALTHPVSEFVNTGIELGFAVPEMGEWRVDGDEKTRLLTIRFGAGPTAGSWGGGFSGHAEEGGRKSRDTSGLRSVGEKAYFDTDL